jgi:acyl-CoA thioesterase FadM
MPRICTRRILIGDVDSAGIAFTVRIIGIAMEVLEEALVSAGLEWSRILREGRFGAPMVHLETDFLYPLRHGDLIHGDMVCERIGDSSYTCRVDLRQIEADRLAASVRFIAACIDNQTFTTIPVPKEFRDSLERLMAKE